MRFLHFLYIAIRAYRVARSRARKVVYIAITEAGVPQTTVIVGLDRDAWRVSQIAVESSVWKV